MKGIFSTFSSVKSPLLRRTGIQDEVMLFIAFRGKAFVVIEEGLAAEMKQRGTGIE